MLRDDILNLAFLLQLEHPNFFKKDFAPFTPELLETLSGFQNHHWVHICQSEMRLAEFIMNNHKSLFVGQAYKERASPPPPPT